MMILELLFKWTRQDGADATYAPPPQSPQFPQDINNKLSRANTHLIQPSKGTQWMENRISRLSDAHEADVYIFPNLNHPEITDKGAHARPLGRLQVEDVHFAQKSGI